MNQKLTIQNLILDIEHDQPEGYVDSERCDRLNELLSVTIQNGLEHITEQFNEVQSTVLSHDLSMDDLTIQLPDIDADEFIISPALYFQTHLYLPLLQAFCQGVDSLSRVDISKPSDFKSPSIGHDFYTKARSFAGQESSQNSSELSNAVGPFTTVVGDDVFSTSSLPSNEDALQRWLAVITDNAIKGNGIIGSWLRKQFDIIFLNQLVNRLNTPCGRYLLAFCEALFPKVEHKEFIERLCICAMNANARGLVFQQYLHAITLAPTTSHDGFASRLILQLRMDYLSKQKGSSVQLLQTAIRVIVADLRKPQPKFWLDAVEQFVDIHLFQGLKVNDISGIQNLHRACPTPSALGSVFDHSDFSGKSVQTFETQLLENSLPNNKVLSYQQPIDLLRQLIQSLESLQPLQTSHHFHLNLKTLNDILAKLDGSPWAESIAGITALHDQLRSVIEDLSPSISWVRQIENMKISLDAFTDYVEIVITDNSLLNSESTISIIKSTFECLDKNLTLYNSFALDGEWADSLWSEVMGVATTLVNRFDKSRTSIVSNNENILDQEHLQKLLDLSGKGQPLLNKWLIDLRNQETVSNPPNGLFNFECVLDLLKNEFNLDNTGMRIKDSNEKVGGRNADIDIDTENDSTINLGLDILFLSICDSVRASEQQAIQSFLLLQSSDERHVFLQALSNRRAHSDLKPDDPLSDINSHPKDQDASDVNQNSNNKQRYSVNLIENKEEGEPLDRENKTRRVEGEETTPISDTAYTTDFLLTNASRKYTTISTANPIDPLGGINADNAFFHNQLTTLNQLLDSNSLSPFTTIQQLARFTNNLISTLVEQCFSQTNIAARLRDIIIDPDLHTIDEGLSLERSQTTLDSCFLLLVRSIAIIDHRRSRGLQNTPESHHRNRQMEGWQNHLQKIKQQIELHYPTLPHHLMLKGNCLFSQPLNESSSNNNPAVIPKFDTPPAQPSADSTVSQRKPGYWPLLWPQQHDLNQLSGQMKDSENRGLVRENLNAIATLNHRHKTIVESFDLPKTIDSFKRQKACFQDLQEKSANDFCADDGGMLIFWPMLSHLFKSCKLVTQTKSEPSWHFFDKESQLKARDLLVYVFNGEKEPEGEDQVYGVINVLIGMPLETLVLEQTELTEQEILYADAMIKALLGQWTALKSMSVDGLRKSFLQRKAHCKAFDMGCEIKVEKQTLDIMLSKLPWGVGLISLPWLGKQLIRVNWSSGF